MYLVDEINHYLISFGTQYEATGIAEDLVVITGPDNYREVFLSEDLIEPLRKCNSTSEITELLKFGGMAI